ncbi:MAG TPA: helix-turn-helix domain-containing protein [Gaiellaceae bacterium]
MTRELSKRPYRMKKRAELQERTRRRITESAVELHGTLGPSRTSISAVAAHAGVRRSTLYRHFPDEAALFAACTAHWLDANPQPDLTRWAAIKDPDARLRAGLAELYAYYQQSEGMLANVLRDEATMPTVARMLAFYRDYLARAGETLMAGRRERGRARQRVGAAIGHALAFTTWSSLAREQRLDDAEATELMCGLVDLARRAR